MKLSALKKSYWVLAAMFVSLVSLVGPQKSFATDAGVSRTERCYEPLARGISQPRFTAGV